MISAEIAAIRKKRVPDQFSIGITARCPNRCIHCGAAGIKPEKELTLDEISGAIDQSLELGSYLISFDGGETMIWADHSKIGFAAIAAILVFILGHTLNTVLSIMAPGPHEFSERYWVRK